jgi:hypothetical protein
MRIRSRLDRLEKCLRPHPRIAAAVVDEASGRVVQVLRGPLGFEPAPDGMVADDLPPRCDVYIQEPQISYLGCIDPRTGRAVVQTLHGIDLDVVLGLKPGLTREEARAIGRGDEAPITPPGSAT